MTPQISIVRHHPGVYGWTLAFDKENIDSNLGETSISGCLSAALGSMPEDVPMVEVMYRSVQMGTFLVQALSESPEDVAEQISDAYSALINK